MIKGKYPHIYFELIFIGFSIVLGMGLVSSFLPILAEELDPTGTLVGLVISAWFLARIFIELPSGLISDMIGRRKLLLFGIFLSCIGSLLCVVPSIYALIVGRALWGFGTSFFFLNNTALVLEILNTKNRKTGLGVFQGIQWVGSFIGAPIGALIASVLDFYSVFYTTFTITALSFFVSLFSKDLKKVGGGSTGTVRKINLRDSLAALSSLGLMIVCIVTFIRILISAGVMSTIFQLYLYQRVGIGVALIGIIVGVRTGGFTLSTFIGGYLTEKVGVKRIVIIGLLLQTSCLFFYTTIRAFEHFLLFAFLDGTGVGVASVALVIMLSDITKKRNLGGAIGLYRTFMDFGGVTGPIFFILIWNKFGAYMPFYLAMALIFTSILIILIPTEIKPVEQSTGKID